MDINANDSNIALNTRSKVTLPDDADEQKRKEMMTKDEEYTEFLQNLFDDVGVGEKHAQDEDFDVIHEASPDYVVDEYNHRRDKVPKRILRDLNDEFQREASKPTDNSSNGHKRMRTHIRIPFSPQQRQSIKNQIDEVLMHIKL